MPTFAGDPGHLPAQRTWSHQLLVQRAQKIGGRSSASRSGPGHNRKTSMCQDDSSIDTTCAVGDVSDNEEPPREGMEEVTPFLNPGSGGNKTSESEKEEYDDEPVYRRVGTRNCQEDECPNKGGKCSDHGSVRPTCKIKNCLLFSQRGGFCPKHCAKYGSTSASTTKAAPEKEANKTTKKRKNSREDPSPGARKPPPALGPRKKDVVICKWDKEYKSIMHDRFRDLDNSSNVLIGDVARDILHEFKAQLEKSGGLLLEKMKGGEYSPVSDDDAIRKITEHIKTREKSAHLWRDGTEKPVANDGGCCPEESLDHNSSVHEKSSPDQNDEQKVQRDKDIILSFRDHSNFKAAMFDHFRAMDKRGSRVKTKDAAKVIFEGFVLQLDESNGRFWRREGKEILPVDRGEALQIIEKMVSSRWNYTHHWRNYNDLRTAKNRCAESVEREGELSSAPKKRQRISNSPACDEDVSPSEAVKAISRSSKSRKPPCVVNPMGYVGNHVVNLLQREGWAFRWKSGLVGDLAVVYRKGCCKKTAEEGKDKITGYENVAKWAYLTGYYKKHVVGSDEGMEVLRKAGIGDDPYSIFKDVVSFGEEHIQCNEKEQKGREGKKTDSQHENRNGKTAVSGVPGRVGGGAATDRGSNQGAARRSSDEHNEEGSNHPIVVDPAPESEPACIRDEEGDTSENKTGGSNFGNPISEIEEMFKRILTRYQAAEEDPDSNAFYSHLIQFLEYKARKQEFDLGADKVIIEQAMEKFEAQKEDLAAAMQANIDAAYSFRKHMIAFSINEVKKRLLLT